MLISIIVFLLFTIGSFMSTTIGIVRKSVKLRHKFFCSAFPNKPKREDDVVYVSEEECRVVTTDYRRMDTASAEYIMKHMPTHSFGRVGQMKMKKLYNQAKEQLESKEVSEEQQQLNTDSEGDFDAKS